jgi:DNA-binding phage protein
MAKCIPFEVVLNDYLKTPERTISYLKSTFEENNPDLFQAALQDVITAQGESLISLSPLSKLVENLQNF